MYKYTCSTYIQPSIVADESDKKEIVSWASSLIFGGFSFEAIYEYEYLDGWMDIIPCLQTLDIYEYVSRIRSLEMVLPIVLTVLIFHNIEEQGLKCKRQQSSLSS